MTYLQYHGVFILPPLLALIAWSVLDTKRGLPLAGHPNRRALMMLGLHVAIAVIYTTPWDNYLVARGIWYYGVDRVIGTWGYVPIEEYFFFVLQTLITGLWLLALRRRYPEPLLTEHDTKAAGVVARALGASLFLFISASGVLARLIPAGTYYGLITMWATPILALMWALGGDLLWHKRTQVTLAFLLPTVYLALTDRIALAQGIWEISPAWRLPFELLGLPFEEALFFLLTNMLVAFGMTLALEPATFSRLAVIKTRVQAGGWWRLALVLWGLSMIPTPLIPDAFNWLSLASTGLLALGVFGYAWDNYRENAFTLFAVAFGFGVVIEFIGYQTGFPFGDYSYTTGVPNLLGVPLIVPLGWFAFTLIALNISPVKGRLWLAPWALVAWDVGLDPLMVNRGIWTFSSGWYYGVPLSNFIGWYVAGVLLVWGLMRLEPRLATARSLSLQLTFVAQVFLLTVGLVWFGVPFAALAFLLAMGSVVMLSGVPQLVRQQQGTFVDTLKPLTAWMDTLEPLKARFQRELDVWIGRTLPLVIRHSLASDLQGVWVRGDTDALQTVRPLLIAANHHSWWDGYAIWLLRERLGSPTKLMMADWQLERFSFFRHQGIISQRELRRALGDINAGEALVIFPEGELRPAGQVADAADGMAFLSRHTHAQVLPLALRTVLRGGQYPEMYIDIGSPTDAAHWHAAINAQLAALDACIASSDPESPLAGFSRYFGGRSSFHQRVGWFTKLRQRLGKQGTMTTTTHDTRDTSPTNG